MTKSIPETAILFQLPFSQQLPEGTWKNEPDFCYWVDAGNPCFILRNYAGCWSGYIGIDSTHPYYQQDYSNLDLACHWSLTFSGTRNEIIDQLLEGNIALKEYWWLGFDTAHARDIMPLMAHMYELRPNNLGHITASYKDINYMQNELAEMSTTITQLYNLPREYVEAEFLNNLT